MNQRYKVVGLGEILWDMLPNGKQLGGAPANFAYISSLFGSDGIVASRIGNDSLGTEAVQKLAPLGVTAEFVQRDTVHPTGVVQVEIDHAGQPTFEIAKLGVGFFGLDSRLANFGAARGCHLFWIAGAAQPRQPRYNPPVSRSDTHKGGACIRRQPAAGILFSRSSQRIDEDGGHRETQSRGIAEDHPNIWHRASGRNHFCGHAHGVAPSQADLRYSRVPRQPADQSAGTE